MNKNIGSQNNVFKKWQTVLADDCRSRENIERIHIIVYF